MWREVSLEAEVGEIEAATLWCLMPHETPSQSQIEVLVSQLLLNTPLVSTVMAFLKARRASRSVVKSVIGADEVRVKKMFNVIKSMSEKGSKKEVSMKVVVN